MTPEWTLCVYKSHDLVTRLNSSKNKSPRHKLSINNRRHWCLVVLKISIKNLLQLFKLARKVSIRMRRSYTLIALWFSMSGTIHVSWEVRCNCIVCSLVRISSTCTSSSEMFYVERDYVSHACESECLCAEYAKH